MRASVTEGSKTGFDVRIERGPAIALFEKFGFTLTRTREHSGRQMLDFYLDLYQRHGFSETGIVEVTPLHAITWARK